MKIRSTKILLHLMFLLLENGSALADSRSDIKVEVHQEVEKDDGCGCRDQCCDPCKEIAELKELVTNLAACFKETKVSVNEIKEIVEELSSRNCTEDDVCPSPFTKVGEECFYRGEMNDSKNWDDARAYCIKLGGDLATPENVPLLREYLKEIGMPKAVWIGGHDRENHGDWKYLNGQEIKESDWEEGQPDTKYNEHCLEIRSYYSPPVNNYWCHRAQGFVCQYGASGCPPGVGCGRRSIE